MSMRNAHDDEAARTASPTQDEAVRVDPLDPAQQNISEGTRALEAAYTSREVSLSSLLVGAVIVAALAGVLIALVLFSKAA